MHYDDTETIVTNLMPLLKQHNYDVYFNGHEHLLNYAHAPDDLFKEPTYETEIISWYEKIMNLIYDKDKKTCHNNFEFFPNLDPKDPSPRKAVFNQGDKLH